MPTSSPFDALRRVAPFTETKAHPHLSRGTGVREGDCPKGGQHHWHFYYGEEQGRSCEERTNGWECINCRLWRTA